MELCHLSLLNSERFCPYQGSARTSALLEIEMLLYKKWKVPHYRKIDSFSEPRHLRFIQAVHHSEQFCGKSNITLADGVGEGKKSFLTSKTTAV